MKISNFYLLFFLLLALSSCRFDLFRDMSKCFPTIEMESVEMLSNDTALVIARITDPGDYFVEYTGFGYSMDKGFDLRENQIIFDGSEVQIGALLPDLKSDTTYYVQAFAANDCGYGVTEKIALEVPKASPPHIPCNLDEDQVSINGQVYPINIAGKGESWTTFIYSDYAIRASSGLMTLTINFHEEPENGIYYVGTEDDFLKRNKNVIVTLRWNSAWREVKTGSYIYVEEIDEGKFKVSICDLKIVVSNNEFQLVGEFSTY
ncbi:MAG: hypothetical protein KDE26_21835 [Bacteroidetes bacterium]|nr:hypothetical protein [Bacteroidota bacterium]MCB0845913.1 hypothetical protein [Bacteroidota bacterium]